jgi:hypothetical protein
MSKGMGSNGIQLSDVYIDDKAKEGRARLFRKFNGFSPEQLLKAKQVGNDIREKAVTEKIDLIAKEEAATIEADQYVRRLMSAAKALSNPGESLNQGETDAFGSRIAELSSSDPNVNANNIVSVAPASGAAEGSLSIRVNRIATKDKITGSKAQASTTVNITANETRIYIKGTEIKIPANATLDEIVGAINAKKVNTHVESFARKFSNTDYRLFMSNSKEGEKITFETIVNKLTGSFDSNIAPLNLAGTLVIGGEDKVITPTMTLDDIATLISTVPTFSATVGGAGPYTLDITENAVSKVLTDVATEKLMDQLGLKESGTSADALQAEYQLDGDTTPLYSTSNHIEGVYHDTTIDLLAPSNGVEVTANISRNPLGILNAIDEFMEAYNSLMAFAAKQTARDPAKDYQPMEGAYLAKNRSFIRMIDRIKGIFTNTVAGGSSGLKHVSQIGIRSDANGKLIKDQNKLIQMLSSNLNGVEQIFAFISVNTTGGYFQTKAHPKQVPPKVFGKDIMVSVIKNAAGAYSARLYLEDQGVVSEDTTINIGSADIKVTSSGKISVYGPKDTIYKGFQFYYSGPELSTPIDPASIIETQGFRVSQGLGDLFAEKLSDVVMLPISSDQLVDQENELNKISFLVRKEKLSQEKKLKELKEKNARIMQKEKRKAERFERDLSKVQGLMDAANPFMASLYK